MGPPFSMAKGGGIRKLLRPNLTDPPKLVYRIKKSTINGVISAWSTARLRAAVSAQNPVFAAVERLMTAGVFRDPDLTLQRIGRKLAVPNAMCPAL